METNTQPKPKGQILHIQTHDWRYKRHLANRIASGVVIGFFLLIILLRADLIDILWAIIHYAIIFALIWYPKSLGRIFFSFSFLFPFTWLRDDPQHIDDFGWFVVIVGWIWLLWPLFYFMLLVASEL